MRDLLEGIKGIGIARRIEAGKHATWMKLEEPELTSSTSSWAVDDIGRKADRLTGRYLPCESPPVSEGFLEVIPVGFSEGLRPFARFNQAGSWSRRASSSLTARSCAFW